MKQCLAGQIPDMETIKTRVKAWQEARNNKNAKIKWQIETENAQINLKKFQGVT